MNFEHKTTEFTGFVENCPTCFGKGQTTAKNNKKVRCEDCEGDGVVASAMMRALFREFVLALKKADWDIQVFHEGPKRDKND